MVYSDRNTSVISGTETQAPNEAFHPTTLPP
jgi:hypothetical protein